MGSDSHVFIVLAALGVIFLCVDVLFKLGGMVLEISASISKEKGVSTSDLLKNDTMWFIKAISSRIFLRFKAFFTR